MTPLPSILVTSQDFERIQEAMSRSASQNLDQLDRELERAKLVTPENVPREVITMNSEFIYEDVATGNRRPIRLVYPPDANASEGSISILAPLGSALLGLKEGDEIDWAMPGGVRRLRIVRVVYQPEASGDWSL